MIPFWEQYDLINIVNVLKINELSLILPLFSSVTIILQTLHTKYEINDLQYCEQTRRLIATSSISPLAKFYWGTCLCRNSPSEKLQPEKQEIYWRKTYGYKFHVATTTVFLIQFLSALKLNDAIFFSRILWTSWPVTRIYV